MFGHLLSYETISFKTNILERQINGHKIKGKLNQESRLMKK